MHVLGHRKRSEKPSGIDLVKKGCPPAHAGQGPVHAGAVPHTRVQGLEDVAPAVTTAGLTLQDNSPVASLFLPTDPRRLEGNAVLVLVGLGGVPVVVTSEGDHLRRIGF